MSKPANTFDEFLAEWTGKLAWAPYAHRIGLADLDDATMTDEAEMALLDMECERESEN